MTGVAGTDSVKLACFVLSISYLNLLCLFVIQQATSKPREFISNKEAFINKKMLATLLNTNAPSRKMFTLDVNLTLIILLISNFLECLILTLVTIIWTWLQKVEGIVFVEINHFFRQPQHFKPVDEAHQPPGCKAEDLSAFFYQVLLQYRLDL